MSKGKKKGVKIAALSAATAARRILIRFHPSWRTEFDDLSAGTQADVLDFIDRINRKTSVDISAVLEPRSEQKVFQKERRVAAGALRLLFRWGTNNELWFLGAYIKNNNEQGERYARRILRRTADVNDPKRNN